MILNLVRHLHWRNRSSVLPAYMNMCFGWYLVGTLGADVSWIMAGSMVIVAMTGSGVVLGLESREIRVLPLTRGNRWVTTWLLWTLLVPGHLFVAKVLLIVSSIGFGHAAFMSPETLLLSTLVDVVYAGMLLRAATFFGVASPTSARRVGPMLVSGLDGHGLVFAVVAVGLPPTLALVGVLPTRVDDLTVGHTLVLATGMVASLLGLRSTPRVPGAVLAHPRPSVTSDDRSATRKRSDHSPDAVARASKAEPSREPNVEPDAPRTVRVARKGFGGRLTGIAFVACRHASRTLAAVAGGLVIAGLAAAVLSTWSDAPRFLSIMGVGSAFMVIACVCPWAQWARRLKVLPLSVSQVNALILLTPLLTWLEVWMLLLLAHAALRRPVGAELGPSAVLAYAGVSALTNALTFRVNGRPTGWFWVSLIPCGAPVYVMLLLEFPLTWLPFILGTVGLLGVAAAAWVNHRTLTRAGSRSLAYQRPS